MVDIDYLAVQALANLIGKDLHITGKHHQFHIFRIDEGEQLFLCLCFSVFCHRDTQEGRIIELGERRQIRVVTDYCHHFER